MRRLTIFCNGVITLGAIAHHILAEAHTLSFGEMLMSSVFFAVLLALYEWINQDLSQDAKHF